MQIDFTGHQIEITPALKSFTEEKLLKLEHHFDQIPTIHVTFNVQKLIQKVEATIFLKQKGEVHASAESEDMYASIDALIDKLEKQLMKHKEKHIHHKGD